MEFVLNTIFWTLAFYGLYELIKNILYISEYTKFKAKGIYLIIAVKNQEDKIEGFLRSSLFKILYGKEEYIKKKGNTTGEFQWKIYEKYNGIKKLKAGFVNEMEAREYASFLENCNRMAGYNGSRFSIEYGCPVSEAQEEYDIWKAQFPKNLERTEIRHN